MVRQSAPVCSQILKARWRGIGLEFPIRRRKDYDYLIGRRFQCGSPAIRKLITYISYLVVRSLCGKGIEDINLPCCLMRVSKIKQLVLDISDTTFAPNVLVSPFANKIQLKIFQIDIPFSFRRTGSVLIQKWKLIKVALRSVKETCVFLFSGEIDFGHSN